MMMILSPKAYPPIQSQTTTCNTENSIDLVVVQELREDVKVKSLIEEQNDLTNDPW